jgi:hypothetical protein
MGVAGTRRFHDAAMSAWRDEPTAPFLGQDLALSEYDLACGDGDNHLSLKLHAV